MYFFIQVVISTWLKLHYNGAPVNMSGTNKVIKKRWLAIFWKTWTFASEQLAHVTVGLSKTKMVVKWVAVKALGLQLCRVWAPLKAVTSMSTTPFQTPEKIKKSISNVFKTLADEPTDPINKYIHTYPALTSNWLFLTFSVFYFIMGVLMHGTVTIEVAAKIWPR